MVALLLLKVRKYGDRAVGFVCRGKDSSEQRSRIYALICATSPRVRAWMVVRHPDFILAKAIFLRFPELRRRQHALSPCALSAWI